LVKKTVPLVGKKLDIMSKFTDWDVNTDGTRVLNLDPRHPPPIIGYEGMTEAPADVAGFSKEEKYERQAFFVKKEDEDGYGTLKDFYEILQSVSPEIKQAYDRKLPMGQVETPKEAILQGLLTHGHHAAWLRIENAKFDSEKMAVCIALSQTDIFRMENYPNIRISAVPSFDKYAPISDEMSVMLQWGKKISKFGDQYDQLVIFSRVGDAAYTDVMNAFYEVVSHNSPVKIKFGNQGVAKTDKSIIVRGPLIPKHGVGKASNTEVVFLSQNWEIEQLYVVQCAISLEQHLVGLAKEMKIAGLQYHALSVTFDKVKFLRDKTRNQQSKKGAGGKGKGTGGKGGGSRSFKNKGGEAEKTQWNLQVKGVGTGPVMQFITRLMMESDGIKVSVPTIGLFIDRPQLGHGKLHLQAATDISTVAEANEESEGVRLLIGQKFLQSITIPIDTVVSFRSKTKGPNIRIVEGHLHLRLYPQGHLGIDIVRIMALLNADSDIKANIAKKSSANKMGTGNSLQVGHRLAVASQEYNPMGNPEGATVTAGGPPIYTIDIGFLTPEAKAKAFIILTNHKATASANSFSEGLLGDVLNLTAIPTHSSYSVSPADAIRQTMKRPGDASILARLDGAYQSGKIHAGSTLEEYNEVAHPAGAIVANERGRKKGKEKAAPTEKKGPKLGKSRLSRDDLLKAARKAQKNSKGGSGAGSGAGSSKAEKAARHLKEKQEKSEREARFDAIFQERMKSADVVNSIEKRRDQFVVAKTVEYLQYEDDRKTNIAGKEADTEFKVTILDEENEGSDESASAEDEEEEEEEEEEEDEEDEEGREEGAKKQEVHDADGKLVNETPMAPPPPQPTPVTRPPAVLSPGAAVNAPKEAAAAKNAIDAAGEDSPASSQGGSSKGGIDWSQAKRRGKGKSRLDTNDINQELSNSSEAVDDLNTSLDLHLGSLDNFGAGGADVSIIVDSDDDENVNSDMEDDSAQRKRKEAIDAKAAKQSASQKRRTRKKKSECTHTHDHHHTHPISILQVRPKGRVQHYDHG
jgi:hypothetical protein